jgi:hypothetical protein
MSGRLPSGFESLEPFVDTWAIETTDGRARMRLEQGEAGCATFYRAAKELLAPAIAHLDKKPLAQFDESEKRLMNMMLSFAHASLVAEIQRDDEPRHASNSRHLPIRRAPADVNA